MPKLKFFLLIILYISLVPGAESDEINDTLQSSNEQSYMPDPNDTGGKLAYATSDDAQVVFTNTSHKIDASGWTFTSPMWPSIDTAVSPNSGSTQSKNDSNNWFEMVEPFIYADKARSIDYSLLLNINDTVLEILKSHIKPLSVGLSFEYYFNHDPKINGLPGIKIEVDRKQYRYLEADGKQNEARKWLKFDEKISINEPSQFVNPDWLKFSLVNRQSPSLVAIRRLRVEFIMSTAAQQSTTTTTISQTQANGSTTKAQPSTSRQITPGNTNPVAQARRTKAKTQKPGQAEYDSQEEVEEEGGTPAASNTLLNGRIKPVEAKKEGWWGSVIGRKKRDVSSELPKSIVLTCYQSDRCDWKAESSESIQWSLARQPPSTNTVQSGYYYMSNMNNNNNSEMTKMLKLSLNVTGSATVVDQEADHCIDLAVYVTEKAYLKLYKLKRSSSSDEWNKGNLLMIWAPTIATKLVHGSNSTLSRVSLPNSKLSAMEEGQNGWTVEQLCFGDFFVNKECKESGNCAFGFEMESDINRHHQKISEPISSNSPNNDISSSDARNHLTEQVVAVASLQEFARNKHLNTPKDSLETWQRDRVQPDSDWKFYPKSDYQINPDNVSFVNLFDDAHYHIESGWININQYLDFNATFDLGLDTSGGFNISMLEANISQIIGQDNVDNEEILNAPVFEIGITIKLVDSKFDPIYTNHSRIDWSIRKNASHVDMGINVTERILEAHQDQLKRDNEDNLFKIVLEIILDCRTVDQTSNFYKFFSDNHIKYKITLANVSLSDRCFPNPCQFGKCKQSGTGYEDWNCDCDDKHQGRRCEFGQWCKIDHVTPYSGSQKTNAKNNNSQQSRQSKSADANMVLISGDEYCKRKLGIGSNCSNKNLPLDESLSYLDEGKTFDCFCKDDYYLGDDSKCKQVHLCNSIVCPSIGMICDESKPFNRTQPCHCNEKQDWYPDPSDPINKCIRRQCHDKQKDCGFDAHVCLPTSAGEKPICKCGPKFALKTDDKGDKYCKSTACVLPTLNDCQHICIPDNRNLEHPYTCACHPGYTLQPDGFTCKPSKPQASLSCRPACNPETQICTDVGCKCKQGYIGEGESTVKRLVKNSTAHGSAAGSATTIGASSTSVINYIESVKCLNVCSLTYAENKEQFELIESVCPLGLCDLKTFECRCSDPTSSTLINTKYEPIYSNITVDGEEILQRTSPLCHLKRVCDIESMSYKICKSQGAICVPDYSKPAMFDCVCPPSTEKKPTGSGTISEFKCEQKCSSKKYDCLRRQAICKQVDKDQVKCDCLPGLMFDQHDQKCYLAKYSYSFNLIIANRYYDPESKFHKIQILNSTESFDSHATKLFESNGDISIKKEQEDIHLHQILPQYYQTNSTEKPPTRSIFIADYNQCNITQIIPKSVIEDPYEHDMESFLGYIDQCNEKIHQNVKNYHLNSHLSEDLRQALRTYKNLKEFTVTTNNDSCLEIDSTGTYLNCTIYLQSNEAIPIFTIEDVFNNCDKHGESDKHCWIKPRLLLKKFTSQTSSNQTQSIHNVLNFNQIIPCEIDNFCGPEAVSVRNDNSTSLCSCKCPSGIEVIDIKDLQPRPHEDELSTVSVKEVCAKLNQCGSNSTFCHSKVGSTCQYDIASGSRCVCKYPSYEDSTGRCIEDDSGRLHIALIIVVIVLGVALIISLAINIEASTRSKRLFGRSKQYPLNDFPVSRSVNRSTGVPNPVFEND